MRNRPGKVRTRLEPWPLLLFLILLVLTAIIGGWMQQQYEESESGQLPPAAHPAPPSH